MMPTELPTCISGLPKEAGGSNDAPGHSDRYIEYANTWIPGTSHRPPRSWHGYSLANSSDSVGIECLAVLPNIRSLLIVLNPAQTSATPPRASKAKDRECWS